MNATHTYVTLEVSDAAFDEIKKKLEDAGYQHTFANAEGRLGGPVALIDMHGIAIGREKRASTATKS